MKTAKKITVDGKIYTVNPFTADYGMDTLQSFIELFGPSLGKLLASAKGFEQGKPIMEQDLDLEKIGGSFVELCLAFRGDKAALRKFCQTITINTMVGETSQSVNLDYETRFMGEYLHYFKLVGYSFMEQYRDFLGGFGGLAKMLAVKQG